MDYRINYPISVTGIHIFDDGVAIGAQGSQNAISLTLTFDETWDGLGKIILWFNSMSHDQQICETVLAPSMRVDDQDNVYRVPFPQEILQHHGKVAITIEGTETVEGETVVILTTEYGYFRVLPSSNDVQDIAPEDNPQTILQQVLELVEEATDARDDAQTSETNAAAYASTAQTSASAAHGYASSAASHASDAMNYAQDAGDAAASSASSAQTAGNYAVDAFEERELAQSYAQSANTSAQNAQASASRAESSASSAADSASDASDSVTEAAIYAGNASTSAQQAATSASQAQSAAESFPAAMTDAELDAICV